MLLFHVLVPTGVPVHFLDTLTHGLPLACKTTETVLETVHDSFTVVIPDVGSRDDRNSHPCKVYPIQKHLQSCKLN